MIFSILQMTVRLAMGDQYAVGSIRTPAGEFLLEAKGGNDTVSDDGSHLKHKH